MSSGKVNCTCGWSWNKSDSSKKDMYVCHKCGNANAKDSMKNGGWLDKAQDGTTTMTSKQKRGVELLLKETEKSNKDKKELVTTGQVKNPRSIEYKKQKKELEKRITDVRQDNRTDYVKKLDEEKGKKIELKKQIKKNIIAPLDVTTDIMQLGNFVPNPIGQAIGKIGNIGGAAIDAYQAYDDLSEGNYTNAAINAGSVFLPMALDSQTFRRNSRYLQPGQPLYPLSPQANLPANATMSMRLNPPRVNYIEPFTKVKGMTDTSLLANRALLGTLGAETIYDASGMVSEPEVTPTINKNKVIQYYNTDPKKGKVETPGNLENVQYVPISNSVELEKWKTQKTKLENGGWLDAYNEEVPQAQNGIEGTMAGLTDKGFNYNGAWGGQFQEGGELKFLQPNSDKLPERYRIPFSDPSSELAMSIGGENGEPAYLIPSFKYGRPIYDALEEFRRTGEHLGGPFKTYQEADEWERTVRHPAVENRETIMFPQEKFQAGGSMPGSVGFTYARTKGIPSEGPYAKKTLPSAQNGQEMKFYQEGLDWKPKTISRQGSVIKDDRGQWAHPGEITEIGSNDITMEGVPYPVLGISDTGDTKLMQPGGKYKYKGKKVTEFPMAKNGLRQEQKGLRNLDDLTNFTNYNKSTGWLSKYE